MATSPAEASTSSSSRRGTSAFPGLLVSRGGLGGLLDLLVGFVHLRGRSRPGDLGEDQLRVSQDTGRDVFDLANLLGHFPGVVQVARLVGSASLGQQFESFMVGSGSFLLLFRLGPGHGSRGSLAGRSLFSRQAQSRGRRTDDSRPSQDFIETAQHFVPPGNAGEHVWLAKRSKSLGRREHRNLDSETG